MGRRILRRLIWGYSVCLCPIKGTPGLNEFSVKYQHILQLYILTTCTSLKYFAYLGSFETGFVTLGSGSTSGAGGALWSYKSMQAQLMCILFSVSCVREIFEQKKYLQQLQLNEPHHEKTRFLPMRKQRRRSASR